jgi:phospholipid-transporting ATPase
MVCAAPTCVAPAGQHNLYFSLPAIAGWLATAFFHAALIVVMVLVGADSLDSDSAAGHSWSLLRNGLLMFTIVIITVHLQLAIVIDQWIWLHHLAIWGSIGERGCLLVHSVLKVGLHARGKQPTC